MSVDKKRVLILCTGNSCRSQMAEGLVNAYLGEAWQAFSAGTAPSGMVHPLAVRAMAELDIDISHGATESVDIYRALQPDLVVTVCDNAARNCPVWLGEEEVKHMPFDDPTKLLGSDSDRISACRQVRDLMRDTLLPYLQSL
ncbi:MAG: arsenate reductase ArsC [Caldilineaceae bacterium SB0668_bin_21]|nr:arsenate reductase ArsC [Caldilineaceae bacterium SB0668_bin_21]MYC23410.1 arsenate reductase ArsC [Caldilineaceae bacterium SB0662_bin_25]